MQNLTTEQKRGIVQLALSGTKTGSHSVVSDSFFVKAIDEKTFELDFRKSIQEATNKYLESNKLNPKDYNRSLIYSISNDGKNFTINI